MIMRISEANKQKKTTTVFEDSIYVPHKNNDTELKEEVPGIGRLL